MVILASIKKASKNNQIFALTRKKKPKMKNVKWLVGEIDKNWKELKQTDVLVHLATVGAYKKFLILILRMILM